LMLIPNDELAVLYNECTAHGVPGSWAR
jgi:hypothetical protein